MSLYGIDFLNEKSDEIKSAIDEICVKIQLNFNETPNIEAGIIEK